MRALTEVTRWCGNSSRPSSRPNSCMTSSVEGWTVSPRKSRKKSACFSRTTTSTPARASRYPSIMPAGPPPTTQQVVRTDSIGRLHSVRLGLAATCYLQPLNLLNLFDLSFIGRRDQPALEFEGATYTFGD